MGAWEQQGSPLGFPGGCQLTWVGNKKHIRGWYLHLPIKKGDILVVLGALEARVAGQNQAAEGNSSVSSRSRESSTPKAFLIKTHPEQ